MDLKYYMSIQEYNELLDYCRKYLFDGSTMLYDFRINMLKFLKSLNKSDLHKINMFENKRYLEIQIMYYKLVNKPNLVNFYQRLLNKASNLPIKPNTIDISRIYKEHDTQLTLNFD